MNNGPLPYWAIHLMRRIMGLKPGRYLIVLTVEGDSVDWCFLGGGKVEK